MFAFLIISIVFKVKRVVNRVTQTKLKGETKTSTKIKGGRSPQFKLKRLKI